MTYNTRFKDKLQREQKHRSKLYFRYFTHRHRLGDIDVKNIDIEILFSILHIAID